MPPRHQLDRIVELRDRAVVEVRRALRHVAQARRLERRPILGVVRDLHAADVDLVLGDLRADADVEVDAAIDGHRGREVRRRVTRDARLCR